MSEEARAQRRSECVQEAVVVGLQYAAIGLIGGIAGVALASRASTSFQRLNTSAKTAIVCFYERSLFVSRDFGRCSLACAVLICRAVPPCGSSAHTSMLQMLQNYRMYVCRLCPPAHSCLLLLERSNSWTACAAELRHSTPTCRRG